MATKKMAFGGMGGKMAGKAKAAAGKAAAPALYSEASRQANMKANPGGGGGGIGSVPPPQVRAKLDAARAAARPTGGAMGSRAGMTRPAMTPQVKQGLQGMADKMREAVMQRGKPTLISGMKKGGKAGKK